MTMKMLARQSRGLVSRSILGLATCLVLAGCGAQPGGGGGGGGGGGSGGLEGEAPSGDPTRPDGTGEPVGAAFSMLLSANRTVLIREDLAAGTATLTAQTSEAASFEWTTDAVPGLVDLETLRDVVTSKGVTGSQVLLTAAGDPGAAGADVTVSVTATDLATDAQTTRSLHLRITRPDAPLTISLSGSATRVAPGKSVTLTARISGGVLLTTEVLGDLCTGTGASSPPDDNPPYQITWSFNDDSVDIEPGVPDDTAFEVECLDSDEDVTISKASYRAPIGAGTTVFTIAVRDATGSRVTSTVTVAVAPDRSLTVAQASSESTLVPPGTSVELTARGSGGEPPYQIRFAASGALVGADITHVSGGADLTRSLESGCSNLAENEDCVVEYAAPADQEAPELVTVTITDQLGGVATSTIPLILTSKTGLQVVGVSDPARIDPGGTAELTAFVAGGTAPYTVTFAAGGSGGTILSTGLTTISDCGPSALGVDGVTGQASAVYEAPTAVTSDVITITVCDNVGNQASDTLALTIAPAQSLVVTATGTPSQVQPGSAVPVGISVTATGGTPPYHLVANVQSGGPGGTVVFPSPDFNDTALGTYTPPNNKVGTDVIKIVVTDATGQTGTAFVNISIAEGQALSATLTTASNSINQGACTTLTASAVGGVPPYSYTFAIDATSNPGCLTAPGAACNSCTPDSDPGPSFTSPSTGATAQVQFRGPAADTNNAVRVTVKDAVNSTFTAPVSIFIGSQGQLSVAANGSPNVVLVGAAVPPPPFPVALNATIIGAPDNIAWTQLSGPAGGTGVFEDATAEDTTWYPGTVAGTYILRITVSNNVPLTAIADVTITVVSAGAITAVPGATVSQGQAVTLNQPVSGGAGSLSYQWSFDSTPGAAPAFVPNATSQSVSFTPNAVGSFVVRSRVTDQAGEFIEQTINITANAALNALPSVRVNGVAGQTCIVGTPAPGDGSLDADHQIATLIPNPSGGVPPYSFSAWSATFGAPPGPNNAAGEADWSVPNVAPPGLPVTFGITVTDSTGLNVNRNVVAQLAPPTRLEAISPDPTVGAINTPLQITFFADDATGTGTIDYVLTLVAGPGNCVLPPADIFNNPETAAITCDTAGLYSFTIDFTDDCSTAVVSVPFNVTMNAP